MIAEIVTALDFSMVFPAGSHAAGAARKTLMLACSSVIFPSVIADGLRDPASTQRRRLHVTLPGYGAEDRRLTARAASAPEREHDGEPGEEEGKIAQQLMPFTADACTITTSES